ncbi:MAG: hypothetical protein RBS68_14300 [Anaerolineales bacterium]|jgi:uncharacterized protein YgiM (DUF1202 family)|nr:hypothetical protein [Anaerolineales bacterium]
MNKLLLFLLLVLLPACVPAPELDNAPAGAVTSAPSPTQTGVPVSPTPQVARICADWLNVRQNAGITHPIIASLTRGETITVHAYTTTVDGAT